MKKSAGTVIPAPLRAEVYMADHHRCVGPRVGMPGECQGSGSLDHVRASGGIGLKSVTERGNLVYMCLGHHRLKTDNGRVWRPRLLAYIEERDAV